MRLSLLRWSNAALLSLLSLNGCGDDGPSGNHNLNIPDAALEAVCGDGLLGAGEECDEGAANSDTEPDRCREGCRLPYCGDGVVDSGEACDGSELGGATCAGQGFLGGTVICTGSCELDTGGCEGAICGNGEVEGDEGCDDGNTEDGDGCSATCVEEAGWECSEEACVAVCGDDLLRSDEGCDDGNTEDGDGCSASCAVEVGWSCGGEPSTCQCAPYFHGAACDECRVHVDAGTEAATPDGLTWPSAFATVQEGIALAAIQPTACEVWVAEGTYLAWAGTQSDTFQLVSGVAVYGGFAGDETSRGARSWVAHPTVLDGREPGSSWRRVFHVVTGANEAVLDGFTITGGRADGVALDGSGGGLIASGVSPTVSNCRFEDNEARWGGALYLGVGSVAEVWDSTFDGNQADYGGAVASVDASVLLRGLLLQDNAAAVSGGAVYVLRGYLHAMESTFDQNRSEIDGGGLVGVDAYVMMEGSTFTGNAAYAGGGLLAFDGAILSVAGTLFESNQARQGAGVYVERATLEMRDSDVTNNVSPEPNEARGAGLYAADSDVFLQESRFSYNQTGTQLTHAGGAVYLDACSAAEMDGVDFEYNESGAGGAIWSRDTPLILSWCRFDSNHATGGVYPNGGAIDVHGGSLALHHSELRQNSASGRGGAVSVSETTGNVLIGTCLVAGNAAGVAGSGLAFAAIGPATVAQSTISAPGGSFVAVRGGGLAVINSILEGGVVLDQDGSLQLSRCLVPLGFSSTCLLPCVEGSPGFVGNGDYHLADGSLGISAGGEVNLNPYYTYDNLDLDGIEWDTTRDLGCFVY